MKNKNIYISLRVGALVLAGALIGVAASAQSAWENPTSAPPAGNIAAPLNTGSVAQGKLGALAIGQASPAGGINLDVTGNAVIDSVGVLNLVVATGTPAAGKVLTSVDSAGTVSWQTPSSVIPEPTFYTYTDITMPGWNSATQTMWISIGNYSFCAITRMGSVGNYVARVRKNTTSGLWEVQYAGMTDGFTVGCF